MKPVTTRIREFRGLRSGIDPERMSAGDLVRAINVQIDQTGRLSRRAGHSLANGSARSHSVWSGSHMTLAVMGNDLCRINDNYSITVLATAIGYGHVSYAEVDGRVYWSSAAYNGCIDGGVNRSWGLPAPVADIGQTAGLLPAGLYQAATTWRRNDAQEGGSSAAFLFSLPDNGGISLAAPASDDATIEACVLYVSPPGSTTLYRAGECAPGQSLIFAGPHDLSAPLLTQFMDRPPPCSCMAYAYGRMWLGIGDVVLPSEAFSPEMFDMRNDLPMDATVTLIAPQQESDGIFVGTTKGMMYLEGADPAAMKLVPKDTSPVLRGSLVYIDANQLGDGESEGQIPVWAAENGIYAGMPDGSIKSLTLKRHRLDIKGPAAMYFDHSLKQIVLSAD